MFSSKCFEISAFHPSCRKTGLLCEPSKILIPSINPYLYVENFQWLVSVAISTSGVNVARRQTLNFGTTIITLSQKLGLTNITAD